MTANKTEGSIATSAALAARWHQSMSSASFKGQGAGFWDTWARSLPSKREHSGYTEQVLRLIQCEENDTVLDVGAGTGALSLPLARRARLVTALDHSATMLEILAKNAAEDHLDNIKLLQLDWTKAKLGVDFPQHDIVLVSRSLPAGEDILQCLDLINRAAGKWCYITWRADGNSQLEENLCARLGLPYHPFPDYTIIRDIILSLGITPHVEIFATNGKRFYGSPEQAYTQIVRGRAVSETEKRASLEFLAANLQYEDGAYVQPEETRWALISWRKSD